MKSKQFDNQYVVTFVKKFLTSIVYESGQPLYENIGSVHRFLLNGWDWFLSVWRKKKALLWEQPF